LTEGKAFYLLPEVNYGKYPGVAASFLITVSNQPKKTLIDKQIRARLDRLVFASTDQKEFSNFVMVCLNMAEADETHRWIQGLDGVERVRMDLIKETILPTEYLDREIEKHLQLCQSISA